MRYCWRYYICAIMFTILFKKSILQYFITLIISWGTTMLMFLQQAFFIDTFQTYRYCAISFHGSSRLWLHTIYDPQVCFTESIKSDFVLWYPVCSQIGPSIVNRSFSRNLVSRTLELNLFQMLCLEWFLVIFSILNPLCFSRGPWVFELILQVRVPD